MDGTYRVAIQQVTPLPQIGVPAHPHPIYSTAVLEPASDETVRVVVDNDLQLSEAMVK